MIQNKRWSNFRNSFQFKLFSIFSILTFLISCLLCILYIVSETNKTRHNANELLKLRATQLATSIRLPLYGGDNDLLRQLAEQAAQTPTTHAVIISAQDGKVIVEVFPKGQTGHSADVISQTAEVRSNPLVDSVESAMTGNTDKPDTRLGFVRIEQERADLSHALHKVIVLSISMAIVFWLSVTLLCHLVLRRVTRSFNVLVQGVETMQNGNFSARIEISSDDEPGRAARAINNLAAALQQSSAENSRLQDERMNIERQMLNAQKLESLGVMAGGIAHDYNNLLQSILGNIEMASLKLKADTEPFEFLANATKSGKHAAQLTNMMLTYISKGHIIKKELNLNELVQENSEMLRTAATAAVSIELALSEELPLVMADEAHLQQVVMNLITNAAESIDKHPGLIKLSTGIQRCDQACLNASLLSEKPEPGRFAFLEVSDNGCGMNKDTLDHIFDPFFTTKFTGRGLGMSAVMGIIRGHHGALFVESEPGKGTTFKALFPIPENTPPAMSMKAAPSSHEASTLPEQSLSGIALVVDDEKLVLKIGVKMVTLCGFTVITACDGAEAVATFKEHADEIAVVLMDLTMPNMDGLTAMSEIYRIRPDAKIILSSGFNEDELGERITGQPPAGFIRKPYSLNALKEEIRRVTQGS
jgi:signal transduction histidine kinase/CheY-like chemotaxis protein